MGMAFGSYSLLDCEYREWMSVTIAFIGRGQELGVSSCRRGSFAFQVILAYVRRVTF